MSTRKDPTSVVVVDNQDVQIELKQLHSKMSAFQNDKMSPPVVPADSQAFEDRREQVSHQTTTCSVGAVLLPKNTIVRWWQVVVTASVILTCIVDSFMPAFDSTVSAFWELAYCCDIIFLVDIIMTFFVAFVNKNGITVKDRKIVRKRYLTRSFVVDLLSVLPTDVIAAIYPGVSVWKTLTVVRLNRLIRFYRISIFCSTYYSL